jgi:hypothetical protein
MDQIITALSQNLNLPESTVRTGVGILLNFIRQKAGGPQFDALVGMLPGAAELMSATPAAESGGGGLLGGLLSQAGGLLGKDLSGAAEAAGALQGAGIPLDKAGPLASGFFDQAKTVAGEDAVNAVLKNLPALASLLGNK